MLYKVYVNGIEVSGVQRIDTSYRIVPQLSTCSITLLDAGGNYIVDHEKGGIFISETALYTELEKKAKERGIRIDSAVPIFKDNDIVHVVEKREDGNWWWVFHGYVTTVSYRIGLDGSDTITLECESGLKSLRTNSVSVNAFLLPANFKDNETMRKAIDDTWSAFKGIEVADMVYTKKIETLFLGSATQQESNPYTAGEGSFEVSVVTWEDIGDVEEFMTSMYNKNNIGALSDDALISFIQDYSYYPQAKMVWVVSLGDAAHLKNLHDVLFANMQLNSPQLTPKLSILQEIVNPLNFVAYTLPCGDVVIEPMLNGVMIEDVSMGGWIPSQDLINSPVYSFQGASVKTVALTHWSYHMVGKSAAESSLKYVPPKSAIDIDAVKAYGVRVVKGDEQSLTPKSEATAQLYAEYLLARSWSMAKSATAECVWRGRGGLNRPQYFQSFDGWFLNTQYTVAFESSGRKTAKYELGYGLLWDGTKFGVETPYLASNLKFLFDMYNYSAGKVTDKSAVGAKLLTVDSVKAKSEPSGRSDIWYDPEGYFQQNKTETKYRLAQDYDAKYTAMESGV